MVRHSPERVLLIGDTHQQVRKALSQAIPGADVTSVPTVFDGIGELSTSTYTTVLAAAEPIERRPEPAVRELRQSVGNGRLVLFGEPTLEPVSRRMMQFGCDDYLITPADPADLHQLFWPGNNGGKRPPAPAGAVPVKAPPPPEDVGTYTAKVLAELPIAELLMEALLHHPHDAVQAAVKAIHEKIAPAMELRHATPGAADPEVPPGHICLLQPIRSGQEEVGVLQLFTDAVEDDVPLRDVMTHIAGLFGQAVALQDRHNRLQKLAINDDLTGLYNARYFRHFLGKLLDRARLQRFPVTLLLFDIDDFKKYNDQYGHGCGDEILRQTAQLMRRCCREHDLVARIGGDEFAVVFWDKEGPRLPRDPKTVVGPFRPPQTPLQVFARFKRIAGNSDFSGLGASGRGRLTVSGGLAVFPYDAQDTPGLIKAADDYLMFKAKKAGKNSVYLVGENDPAGQG